MRKQTKVLVATALLALGASFTSMAAAKTGTWNLEDEGWMCYDKDGDAYTEVFCLSYGKEYWVGDDGLLVTSSWVDDGEEFYYVGSDGSKTVNDWRFVAPEEDEDADEEWFYFNAKGERVEGKAVIKGETYYFDNEGKMLTGWVEYDADTKKAYVADETPVMGDLVYCDENGARVNSDWIKVYAPGIDEDEQDDENQYWYYLKSKGGVQYSKATDIEGKTYLFGDNGQMLTGWVKGTDSDNDTKLDTYEKIDTAMVNDGTAGVEYYYCGTADQGYVKKDRWVKTWNPTVWADADDDYSKNWYYLTKTGAVLVPNANTATDANAITFVDGESRDLQVGTDSNATFVTINKKTYAFSNSGAMMSGLIGLGADYATDDVGAMYYFGGSDDGAMKTGDIMIEDEDGYEYEFFFGENDKNDYKKGVAVNGAAEKSLYKDGLLVKAETYKYEKHQVGTKYYIVNANGTIQTSKKQYKEDGELLYNCENATFYTTLKTPAWGNVIGDTNTAN